MRMKMGWTTVVAAAVIIAGVAWVRAGSGSEVERPAATHVSDGAAAGVDGPVGPTGSTTPPGAAVARTSPAANHVGAGRTDPIVLTLDAALDPDGFEDDALLVFGRWSGVVAGAVSLEAGGAGIRFEPARPFQAGEAVTVSLRSGLATAGGGAPARGHVWTFWIATAPGSLDMIDRGEASERTVLRDGEDHVQPYGAYAGDFNGDGFGDLAIPNEVSGDVRVMINDGRGNYEEFDVLDVPQANFPSPNEGADFNRDGHIDFAVGSAGNKRVAVFLGDGRGGFRLGTNLEADQGVRGVCILDLNQDGWPDVATANMGGRSDARRTRGSVSILMNDGTGSLSLDRTIASPGRGEKTCATADANGDGIEDLFVGAFNSDEILVYLGDGQGGLELAGTTPAGGNPWMITTADVNGDGHVDVLSANREEANLGVLLGDGRGGLAAPVTYDVGELPLAVDAGDLDGDGDLDVVTSDYSGNRFTVYENLGDGTFGNARALHASAAGSCAILHDRDGDGDLDITGVDEVDDKIFLFENPGAP